MVDLLPRHSKVKGSILATAAGTRRERKRREKSFLFEGLEVVESDRRRHDTWTNNILHNNELNKTLSIMPLSIVECCYSEDHL